MTPPPDYPERVYAGVLGKIIGVYLGRPFEQWRYERIQAELGNIDYYVNDRLGLPLVVSDDDITGTFTFLRALPDHGCSADLTPAQIGWTWRNYIIENETVLWWGGRGMSTEHTAFLNLQAGINAPASGSMALNGAAVAEQIGAQIFIDGWAMVHPGEPARAADFARRAASVSHDGEAIYAAQVVAAMESMAFVESNLDRLLDIGTGLIPRDSVIYRMIADLREWCASEPDWRRTREKLQARYGYEHFRGQCHVVPNHAVIILGLLYGKGNFQRALSVTCTAGYDTDCNAANVGCLMGIKDGLGGINAGPDWRGPVADQILLPTADGGRAITDAVRETYEIVNIARVLHGLPAVAPKDGARFHFELPGATQGFRGKDSAETHRTIAVANVEGRSTTGARTLALRYAGVTADHPVRAATPTFIAPSLLQGQPYKLIACPTLYSGQTIRARVAADPANAQPARVGLYVQVYGADNALEMLRDTPQTLSPQADAVLNWTVPDTHGQPIAEVGLEIAGESAAGTVYLDWLTWSGSPSATWEMAVGDAGRRAWVRACDGPELPALCSPEWPWRIIQNKGAGMSYQGEFTWDDYAVSMTVQPEFGDRIGILANVRGLYRYTALTLGADRVARLIHRHDAEETVLAEAPCEWDWFRSYQCSLVSRRTGEITGRIDAITLSGRVDGRHAMGAAGMLVHEGNCRFGPVRISPVDERLPGT